MDIIYANLVDSLKDLSLKNMLAAATVTPALPRRSWSEFFHILKPS